MDVKGPGAPLPPLGTQSTGEPVKTESRKTEPDTSLKAQQSIDKAAQQVLGSHVAATQTGQSTKVLQLQQRLLNDPGCRAEFAANPGRFLDAMGVILPPNLQAPASIPLDQINQHLDTVQNALQKQNIGLNDVPKDPATLTRFIENNLGVKAPNLPQIIRQQVQGGGPVETVAVTATAVVAASAVVAAVVSVEVSVTAVGKTAPGGQVINGGNGADGA